MAAAKCHAGILVSGDIKLVYIFPVIFSCINVSQRSVTMQLTCGVIFNNHVIANLWQSDVTIKEFWKSVNIWQRWGQKFGGVFLTHGDLMFICQLADKYKPLNWHAVKQPAGTCRHEGTDARKANSWQTACITHNESAKQQRQQQHQQRHSRLVVAVVCAWAAIGVRQLLNVLSVIQQPFAIWTCCCCCCCCRQW